MLVATAGFAFVERSWLGFPDGFRGPADAALRWLYAGIAIACVAVAVPLYDVALTGRGRPWVWWGLAAVVLATAWLAPGFVRGLWPATGA